MHSIKFIRENQDIFDKALKKRNIEGMGEKVLQMDEEIRNLKTKTQEIQAQRKIIAKEIGALKAKGVDASKQMELSIKTKEEEIMLEKITKEKEQKLIDLLSALPNLPTNDVPYGECEEENKLIKEVGEKMKFDFLPKEHNELGIEAKMMDFTMSAELSGARFVLLNNDIAKLERAIGNFMLDMQIKNGYTEYSIPVLVNGKTLYGTGQLPKFEEDLFKTIDGRYLIPSAEVVLTGLFTGKIIDEELLPIRATALSLCFRSEAGAAGKDTKGMFRQHQFSKVEIVGIVKEGEVEEELGRMVSSAESILQALKIPYRVMLLCSNDMGFSAEKTYDIEAWFPGQNRYREISSCSSCGSFQARRMNTRYRKKGEKETKFVQTLNASGLAVGRTLIAVMENYQTKDGDIIVPDVLRDYMNQDIIKRKNV